MADCKGPCDCQPTEPGFYWATGRRTGYREIVSVRKNGHGHVRAFTTGGSASKSVLPMVI